MESMFITVNIPSPVTGDKGARRPHKQACHTYPSRRNQRRTHTPTLIISICVAIMMACGFGVNLQAVKVSTPPAKTHDTQSIFSGRKPVHQYVAPLNLITFSEKDSSIEESIADQIEEVEPTSSSTPLEKIFPTENLSAELQQYAAEVCTENGDFPLKVFMGIMKQESQYTSDAIGWDGHDFGMCQIRDSNFEAIRGALGDDWDWSNPKDSMDAAMFLLMDVKRWQNPSTINEWLMYYNMGPSTAKECFSDGIFNTDYTDKVLGYAYELGYTD